MKLSDLKPGDHITGFEGFSCIPDKDVRIVRKDDQGLFVICSRGYHYLSAQENEHGDLISLQKAFINPE